VNTTNGPQILSSEKDIPELLIKSWWRPQQFQGDDFNLTNVNPWFSGFIVNSNSLSLTSW